MTGNTCSLDGITELASEQGFVLRGGFEIEAGECVPAHESGRAHRLLLLFGQAGSSVWPHFVESAEYADDRPDPMDRWSNRIACSLASRAGGTALFPFDGPPWYPFGQWAQRAERIQASPLGILMHPRFGLWHAYRFAIALPDKMADSEQLRLPAEKPCSDSHACDQCTSKPCLSHCPVNAFSQGVYNVPACAAYLQENEQSDCHRLGCQARDACPEGSGFKYESEHLQFHMQQFYASLS